MSQIPPPNVPLVDSRGRIDTNWYRYFAGLGKAIDGLNAAQAAGFTGTVTPVTSITVDKGSVTGAS